MRNIGLIFRRDAANLFRNVMSVIITVGLVILPSLFAWYNILASWDVFENTGNLAMAVANDDEGFTSDLIALDVNIGDEVVSALRANSQIDWVFTDSEDAIEGAKSGKYYASLVIPKDFSRNMLTFYEGDADAASIDYYVNEKKNAISPNITGTGADTVSNEVNTAFADAIVKVAAAAAQSVSQHADKDDATAYITRMSNRIRTVSNRINEAADVLGLYSSLAKDSQSFVENSAKLVDSARSQADNVAGRIDEDKKTIRDLATRLDASIDGLSDSLDAGSDSLANVETKLQSLFGDVSGDVEDVGARLQDRASDVNDRINELSDLEDTLSQLRDDLQSGVGLEVDTSVDVGRVEIDVEREIELTAERTVVLDKCIAALSEAINTLQRTSDRLQEAANDLTSGDGDIQSVQESLRASLDQAKTDIESQKTSFVESLKPGADQLKASLETLAADLESAASKLKSSSSDLPALADKSETALGNAAKKVDGACEQLRTAAKRMSDLADKIDSALTSGDKETIKSLLAGNADDIATALTAPVQVSRTALFPVENFGSAMTPLYSALALFIGSLLIMVAMKPEVSQEGRKELDNPKPRELYFGRFGAVALLSLMQTTLMGLGNLLFLKVQVAEPLLFMACFWISGLVFAFIIYTLVVAFGNLGKALAVLLLIVQVTGCGGSYPLQILPDFVQTISPFLPATHVVNALRAAMFGVYQNDFWISIGKLALFVVPFLLLGLLLRKPLERFMRFYVRKVEESKLM